MSVGAFPGTISNFRRAIRATPNPLDKSTVISIFPKTIHEIKYTIQPGIFHLEPGSFENPSILVVTPSSYWLDRSEEEPLLEIPNSSVQVADSIVRDFCSGLLGCNMADSMPGLFWIPGEYDLKTIKTAGSTYLVEGKRLPFSEKLKQAQIKQRNYWMSLVRITDSLWARTNGNPLVVSDDARIAAKELSLDKDWMKDFAMVSMSHCPACGNMIDVQYPICPNCKTIIDEQKAKALGLKFAS